MPIESLPPLTQPSGSAFSPRPEPRFDFSVPNESSDDEFFSSVITACADLWTEVDLETCPEDSDEEEDSEDVI